MKATYDKEATAVYIQFKEGAIHESDEDKNGGVIIDYASQRLAFPVKPDYVEV